MKKKVLGLAFLLALVAVVFSSNFTTKSIKTNKALGSNWVTCDGPGFCSAFDEDGYFFAKLKAIYVEEKK